jgi:hypothetical protein
MGKACPCPNVKSELAGINLVLTSKYRKFLEYNVDSKYFIARRTTSYYSNGSTRR